MNEKEVKKIMSFVRFNMDCEGFTLNEENENTGRKILMGQISCDEAVQDIIRKHGFDTNG